LKNIIILLRKVIIQFIFLLLSDGIFNKEDFLNNNLKMYLSQILEKLIIMYYEKQEFIFF